MALPNVVYPYRQVNGERLDKWLCSKDLHPPCFAGAARHLSRPHTTSTVDNPHLAPLGTEWPWPKGYTHVAGSLRTS